MRTLIESQGDRCLQNSIFCERQKIYKDYAHGASSFKNLTTKSRTLFACHPFFHYTQLGTDSCWCSCYPSPCVINKTKLQPLLSMQLFRSLPSSDFSPLPSSLRSISCSLLCPSIYASMFHPRRRSAPFRSAKNSDEDSLQESSREANSRNGFYSVVVELTHSETIQG
jgi:hypothetical protein